MRLALIIPALAILPIAACNSAPDVSATNATPEEVRAKVEAAGGADTIMVQPGRWEGVMTIREMEIPGMPAAAKEQMKAQMGTGQRFISCVTPEDVKEQKAFFTGDGNDKSCKYDHFSMTGGKIAATLNCDRGTQGKMAMQMDGSYSPDAYRMDMASKAEGTGPMGAMTMKMTVDAKRVGACRGSKDES